MNRFRPEEMETHSSIIYFCYLFAEKDRQVTFSCVDRSSFRRGIFLPYFSEHCALYLENICCFHYFDYLFYEDPPFVSVCKLHA